MLNLKKSLRKQSNFKQLRNYLGTYFSKCTGIIAWRKKEKGEKEEKKCGREKTKNVSYFSPNIKTKVFGKCYCECNNIFLN